MWDDLLRVNWDRLTHAYGWAVDVPQMLVNLVSPDKKARDAGWEVLWAAVNHQGDYYDSTVAAIPFLIQAAASAKFADRAAILGYFQGRWLEAPSYGGDPLLAEPPGGRDEPTPLLTDEEFAARKQQPLARERSNGEDDFDTQSYRRMDLCAWQTGRAIRAGQATYQRLLDDPDRTVAAAAANLLMLWPETRAAGKQALARLIAEEPDPVAQGSRVLELAMYATRDDVPRFADWVAPGQPIELRAAAALAWAWAVTPDELPQPAAEALDAAAAPGCQAFGKLPWTGVYHRGPWILPPRAARLLLTLAGNQDDELRWRAVQGLAPGRESAKHLSASDVIPVLVKSLTDRSPQVRVAAALALVQRGPAQCEQAGPLVPALIKSLGDPSASVCGHAARLLALVSERLSASERKAAASGAERAARRFAGQSNAYVMFDSMGTQADRFLALQRDAIVKPKVWDLPALFAEIALPDKQDRWLAPLEVDRRLADAYAADAERVVRAAMDAAALGTDRWPAMGAANWLMTLGPAAEAALPALDAMAGGKFDPYACQIGRLAADAIRRSLTVPPAESTREEDLPADAGSLIERLADERDAVVGIAGRFEFDGRLYHWHQERRSPRARAIRALFDLGRVPPGLVMLRAMLAAARQSAVVCGRHAAPFRFEYAQWQAAVVAAGGLPVAEPAIRAVRQECRTAAWQGENADTLAFVAEAELAEVIRQLSGRVVRD
jgi:hypothetical protein